MPADRRDISKASAETDLPARKPPKRQLADKATKADFGDLEARPSAPRKREQPGHELKLDSGVPDDVDLPSLFSIDEREPR